MSVKLLMEDVNTFVIILMVAIIVSVMMDMIWMTIFMDVQVKLYSKVMFAYLHIIVIFSLKGQPCSENLTAPINGSISCTGVPDQVTDENCSFSCDYGFTFHGSSLRICLSDHSWTGVEPYCVIKHCQTLVRPPNAYVVTKPCGAPCGTAYNTECEIKCVDGYYMNEDSPFHQICSVNDTTNEVYWSEPPICECKII